MLSSLVLIICVIIGIKGLSWINDRTSNYLVAFDHQDQHRRPAIGDEVRVGGFKVGEVKKIMLRGGQGPAHPPYYILIAFSVPDKYSIREDAKIRN